VNSGARQPRIGSSSKFLLSGCPDLLAVIQTRPALVARGYPLVLDSPGRASSMRGREKDSLAMNRTATDHEPVTGWTAPHEHVAHDLASAPRTRWRRTKGTLIIMSLLALGSRAQAGEKEQGTDYQGTIYQNTADPDSIARGGFLEDDQLVGWFIDDDAQTMALEITSFDGDIVHATVHDASASRSVELHPRALAGMHWQSAVCGPGASCALMTYRIVRVSQDSSSSTMPGHSSNHDVWLYEVEFTDRADPTPDDWMNVCDSGAGSPAQGMFVNGRWYQDGSWNLAGYTFSCARGVIAECARDWGYKPWKTLDSAAHGDVSLLPLHLACVRAARADYCGDGISHTRNGTLIDIADRYGFNVHVHIPGFQDESAFGPDTALWVRAPRWPTAHRVRNSWQFATCARPSVPRHAGSESPLLHVRSKTSPGKSIRRTHD
jgi:hypothetical protein